jgi:hypothetical protein
MSYPETIAGCCRELLDASVEPLPIARLVEHAVALGRTKARYPEASVDATLRQSAHVLALDDHRFVSVRRLLEGRVVTTAVPANALLTGARRFDLAPFEALALTDGPELPEDAAGLLLSYRCRDGQVTAEVVDRDALSDGSPLVEAVRVRIGTRPYYGYDLGQKVLQACAADETLLRAPVAPLSELFPDLAPKPPVPAPRRCTACDGTGRVPDWREWEPGWSPDPGPEWPAGSYDDPPYAWRNRLERLEEVVFGDRSYL